MDADILDAAWAQHETLQREFEQELRDTYPQWFTHRKTNENASTTVKYASEITFYDHDKAERD